MLEQSTLTFFLLKKNINETNERDGGRGINTGRRSRQNDKINYNNTDNRNFKEWVLVYEINNISSYVAAATTATTKTTIMKTNYIYCN